MKIELSDELLENMLCAAMKSGDHITIGVLSDIKRRKILFNPKIKLCPFCGGCAVISNLAGSTDFHPTVQCADCSANCGIYDTEEEAIDAWNKRVC